MNKIYNYRNLKLLGVKNFGGKEKMINYYIVNEKNEKFYAFSRKYTHNTFELCKSGVRLEDLKTKKTKDHGINLLIKYTNYMLKYLLDYYSLNVA